ncbi:hypothetical protein TNCT_356181 [Trichonephila clavata]|uniref:Uncharacterized protein n=1 Tax=Trichonephila clavata TaxID=2740835 RepID=A0A8X6LVV4_TRICU|nr:hypothetical protein TNCT_356181 [Trichonephila clavata]
MAESTENAIPNLKKNSKKHVVIVSIEVHQHHDSQISQILDPDKASDITNAQKKNLEEEFALKFQVFESCACALRRISGAIRYFNLGSFYL